MEASNGYDRSARVWPVLLLLTAIMLVHPPSARAERIDINDPALLGPVLQSIDLNGWWRVRL